jgi:hypothetical protein
MTTQLSETQRKILTTACGREDGRVFPISAGKLKGGAVNAVLKSLLKSNMIEEVPASAGDHVWRTTDEGAPTTLRVTSAAREIINVGKKSARKSKTPSKPAARPKRERGETKQDLLIRMLKRARGSTVAQIVEATGWQTHTVRGAIAGALKKKLGLAVTSEKADSGERVYRIEG